MYTIREYLYFMKMRRMSEDPKETGTGTWKVHGWNLDDSGNTTRRGTANRTTRTIRIGKYFEAGPDHIWRQGRVRSSLCRAQVGSLRVLGSSGSWVFGFFGSCKEGKGFVSEIAGMLQQASEKCRKISGTAGKPRVGYGTFPRLVSNILRVLWDITVFPPQGPHPKVQGYARN